tara:strand:- start:7305 stop:7730 length:426 start_codon:yes stop_codon:yes gene_type:complete
MEVKVLNTCKEKEEVINWFNAIGWKGMAKELFPATSYVVYDKDIPVASSYFYKGEGAPIAVLGITISNPDYKLDKTSYINLLLDKIIQEMKHKKCIICYHHTDIHSEKFMQRYMKPRGFVYNKGFSGAVSLVQSANTDFII